MQEREERYVCWCWKGDSFDLEYLTRDLVFRFPFFPYTISPSLIVVQNFSLLLEVSRHKKLTLTQSLNENHCNSGKSP